MASTGPSRGSPVLDAALAAAREGVIALRRDVAEQAAVRLEAAARKLREGAQAQAEEDSDAGSDVSDMTRWNASAASWAESGRKADMTASAGSLASTIRVRPEPESTSSFVSLATTVLVSKREDSDVTLPPKSPSSSPLGEVSPLSDRTYSVPTRNSADVKASWRCGLLVEVLVPSSGFWVVGQIGACNLLEPGSDRILVHFPSPSGALQQLCFNRNDPALAPMGTHVTHTPPGFHVQPSLSRPGMLTFTDRTTGLKYHCLEHSWKAYITSLLTITNRVTSKVLRPKDPEVVTVAPSSPTETADHSMTAQVVNHCTSTPWESALKAIRLADCTLEKRFTQGVVDWPPPCRSPEGRSVDAQAMAAIAIAAAPLPRHSLLPAMQSSLPSILPLHAAPLPAPVNRSTSGLQIGRPVQTWKTTSIYAPVRQFPASKSFAFQAVRTTLPEANQNK